MSSVFSYLVHIINRWHWLQISSSTKWVVHHHHLGEEKKNIGKNVEREVDLEAEVAVQLKGDVKNADIPVLQKNEIVDAELGE